MMFLQSSCFPLGEESAGRAKRVLSAFSGNKMTSPHLKLQQASFLSLFPSQECLMLCLVLDWCLDLKRECCWLSRREVGSCFPALPPQVTGTCPPGWAVSRAGSSPASQCNELQGSSFLICNLFQLKVFLLPAPHFHKHWFHGKTEEKKYVWIQPQTFIKMVLQFPWVLLQWFTVPSPCLMELLFFDCVGKGS